VPKDLSRPAPAILYVCGHAQVKTNGVSCGNKTAYQHHGIWFARHGYVCLILDTVQLGEIEGLHHGTYREGMWWWNARGYTPAGVEAWNSIRALDYLESRSEVDSQRIGMTGRSGGGAYSWTTAALDDRVRVTAPVAGITDLRDHVVHGCVAGHCDCMFFVNQYRWDYPMLAALVAPRPLLIVNTDADGIFPLDGVIRTHAKVRQVYQAYGAATNLGLVIAPGPHRDTQDLQVPVFRWFNQHLKGDDPPIEIATVKLFDPWDLRVFDALPTDAINARIHEIFVPIHPRPEPAEVQARLRADTFAGWPENESAPELRVVDDRWADSLRLRVFEFTSQPEVRLRLFVVEPQGQLHETVMTVLDEPAWREWETRMDRLFGVRRQANPVDDPGEAAAVGMARDEAGALAEQLSAEGRRLVIAVPRGVGPTVWQSNDREDVQIRRRFMLLGQTLEGMRV
jgi:dienelactone hydrolase